MSGVADGGWRRRRRASGILLGVLLCWAWLTGAVSAQGAAPTSLRLLAHSGETPPAGLLAELPGRWLADDGHVNLGLTPHPVWLAVRIGEVPGPQVLYLNNPLLRGLGLYRQIPDTNGAWRAIPPRRVSLPLVGETPIRRSVFEIAPGDYLLRIESAQALRFALKVQPLEVFQRDWRAFLLGQGMYLGLILGLVIYNSVLLVGLRDSSYLWYLGFVLSSAGYFVCQNGLLYEFWPGLEASTNEALMLSTLALLGSCALQFCWRFLLVWREDPGIDGLLAVIWAGAGVGVWLAWWAPGHATVVFFSAFGLTVMSLFLAASLRALRQGFRPARWLLLAWSALVAGAAALLLATYGVLPHGFLSFYGFQLGSAIEAMLLSLALADRISLMQREREALINEQARLHGMSYMDGLTGLHNRRYLDEVLPASVAKAQAKGQPLSLIMLDLDNFKRFNDSWGHAEGDRALQYLAEVIRREVRDDDPVCRFGGEEFVIPLYRLGKRRALEIAERIRLGLASQPLHLENGGRVHLTCTLGVAEWQPGETAGALLNRADRALYRGKHAGRNRVMEIGASMDVAR